MKRHAQLIRYSSGDWGTAGVLVSEGFSCYTLELPWKDNRPNVSCIPAGLYEVELRESPKFGLTYWVRNVPGRKYILFHSGNWAGDREKGLRSHTYGCILVGKYPGGLQGQKAILCSRPTLKKLLNHMNKEPFTLQITGQYKSTNT